MMCRKCKTKTGITLILLAVIYLLVDLGIWNFWGVNWWTALFAVIGLAAVASASCSDCQACCTPNKR